MSDPSPPSAPGINAIPASSRTALLTAFGDRHRSRRDHWAETRLIYDEAPDPAIHSLNLLR